MHKHQCHNDLKKTKKKKMEKMAVAAFQSFKKKNAQVFLGS